MAKGGTQTVTTQNQLTPEQRKVFKWAEPFIERFGESGDMTLSKNPFTVGFNDRQRAGQVDALNAARTQDRLAESGMDRSNFLTSGDVANPNKNAALRRATVAGPNERTAFGLLSPTEGAVNAPVANASDFLLNRVLYPESNPALQGVMEAATRPILRQTTEQLLPGVRSGAAATGNYGSSRQGIAEGLIGQGAQTAIGDTNARIASDAYGQGLSALTSETAARRNANLERLAAEQAARTSRYGTEQGARAQRYGIAQEAASGLYNTNTKAMLDALGLLPQTQAAQMTGALTKSGVGDVRQNREQQIRDEKIYREMFGQLAPLYKAKELVGIGMGLPGGGTTATGPAPYTNPITGALGGLSLGGALAGPLGLGAMGGPLGAGLGLLTSFL